MPVEYPLSTPTSDERTLAVLAHILSIVPGIGILGPLIIYLIRRDGPAFVTENAKESLNFQITVYICGVIGCILMVVGIGFLIVGVLYFVNLVLVIVAAVRVSENKIYRYPFNLRLIK
ncbi:MAG TPA: DUF4870 domain-containing protein [Puia sp.]|nr:DUF4870 domain-containing protein [Puia sp.]